VDAACNSASLIQIIATYYTDCAIPLWGNFTNGTQLNQFKENFPFLTNSLMKEEVRSIPLIKVAATESKHKVLYVLTEALIV